MGNTSVSDLDTKSSKNLNPRQMSVLIYRSRKIVQRKFSYLRISDPARDIIVENQSVIWNKLKEKILYLKIGSVYRGI